MATLDIPFAMFAPKNIELEDNDPMVSTAGLAQPHFPSSVLSNSGVSPSLSFLTTDEWIRPLDILS